MDTICITVEDYCQDFIHLKDQFYDALIQRMQQRIACEYYKALFTAKYVTNTIYLLCVFCRVCLNPQCALMKPEINVTQSTGDN